VITAVDTNVLLDVLGADPAFGHASASALRACAAEGRLVACEIVWAELGSVFPETEQARAALGRLGVDFSPIEEGSALAAGDAWRAYRQRGGRRTRLVADFLIGAHASGQADRLLTRDRGFYRAYFADLEIADPAAPAGPAPAG
jgi:predicted nucleic acid-binding protein